MNYTLFLSLVCAGVFAGMLVCLEVGRRHGRRKAARDPHAAAEGLGTVDGAVFALLGLLLAFTFSGAAARFDTRRQLIVEEANAIGTAYLRLDVLPAEAQPGLRDLFRRYVDTRIAVYRALPDLSLARADLAKASALQGEIWKAAVAGSMAAPAPAAVLLLPALNAMIDITTTRTMATQAHPPPVIFLMLIALALASALLAGYGTARSPSRSWVHAVAFAAVMTVSIYVILDLEFPRFGLIRVDAFDQVLVEVRDSMR